ncbi:MAG: TadE family protein [Candidatus Eisenbacteria bacterium]
MAIVFRRMIDRKKDSRGQAVVEFALVLPLILLILLGITEFGRAFWTLNVVSQAAREGARLAAVGGDQAAVEARVMLVLDAANVTPASGGIVYTAPDPTDPDPTVTVAVSSDFQFLSGNVLPISGTIPLSSTSVMRFEG